MGQLAGNNIYLVIDGVVVTAPFKEVKLDVSNSSQETTMGAGTAHVQRAPGLSDTKIAITLGYDTATVQSIIQHIRTGTVVQIEYGQEGNGSGKPRHVQNFNIVANSTGAKVDKSPSTFDLSGEATDAPVVDMFLGGLYP